MTPPSRIRQVVNFFLGLRNIDLPPFQVFARQLIASCTSRAVKYDCPQCFWRWGEALSCMVCEKAVVVGVQTGVLDIMLDSVDVLLAINGGRPRCCVWPIGTRSI